MLYRRIGMIGPPLSGWGIVCLLLLAWGGGCTSPKKPADILTNPVDPNGSVYVKPKTTILSSPAEGTVVTSSTVEFQVQGNKDAVAFSSKLDNNDWSAWDPASTIVFDNLDEGAHTIIIRSRHRDCETIEENPPSVSFVVNAITGPALKCVPRKVIVARGSQFGVEVYAEEATAFAGAKIIVEYDKNALSVVSVDVYKDAKSILMKNNGSVIDITETDNANGRVTINVANANGSPANVSGTGAIGMIWFRAIAPGPAILQTSITNGSQLRTADNLSVPITAFVGQKVDIR